MITEGIVIGAPPPVTFDFTTAAVVSFILTLLGMAAGLLLMLKFGSRTIERKN